jgi:hypothetical protein
MKTKIFISLFILYFLGACNLPTMSNIKHKEVSYYSVTFRIKGTITDSTNNSSVFSALVTLSNGYGLSRSANTNNEGHYTIEYTADWESDWDGSYLLLVIRATGYKTKGINYEDKNHVRLTEEWQIIDVQLEPESSSYPFSR